MNKHTFAALMLAAFCSCSAFAQQAVDPSLRRPNARGAVPQPQKQPQQQLRDVPKGATQDMRNPNADQARRDQVQRNKTANAVVDRYVGGFQKSVGLNDDQTEKLSVMLDRYVRQQLMLAERRNALRKQLKEMTDNQAPEDQIQAQYEQVVLAERQQTNREKQFYDGVNPLLTPQQRARLKIYLEDTGQDIRQAIQKSTQ